MERVQDLRSAAYTLLDFAAGAGSSDLLEYFGPPRDTTGYVYVTDIWNNRVESLPLER